MWILEGAAFQKPWVCPYFISGELLGWLMKTNALWKCARGSVNGKRVGCNYWNVYQSKNDMPLSKYNPYKGVSIRSKTSPYGRACRGSGVGTHRRRKVDTRCRHCNARARFQLSEKRGDGRGRPRRVKVMLEAVKDFDVEQLLERCNQLNRGEYDERYDIGFVRAKNYERS